MNSDAGFYPTGTFGGCSPGEAVAGWPIQSCALDKTALFLILLIFPKLLLPEMTWQVLRRDVLWFLVQEVLLPALQWSNRSLACLQPGIIMR